MTLPDRGMYKPICCVVAKIEDHARDTQGAPSMQDLQKHPLYPLVMIYRSLLSDPHALYRYASSMDCVALLPTAVCIQQVMNEVAQLYDHRLTMQLVGVLEVYGKVTYGLLGSIRKSRQFLDDIQMEEGVFFDDAANTSDEDQASPKDKKRSRMTRQSNEYMTAWFVAHKDNPYPTPEERREIAASTDLSELQVKNWFANMRKRHWRKRKTYDKSKPRRLIDYALQH